MKRSLLVMMMGIAMYVQAQDIFTGREAMAIVPGSEKVIMSELNQAPSFIELRADQNIPGSGSQGWLANALKMSVNDGWAELRSDVDVIGYTHTRYRQTYKGVPVEGGIYISHINKGRLESANGEFFRGLDMTVLPAIDEKEALAAALDHVGATVYKWELPEEIRHMKEVLNKPNFTYYPKAELVICPESYETWKKFSLAYKFDIYAHEPLKRLNVFVDAHSGKVIMEDSKIWHVDAPGTASTLYSGTQNITTDSYQNSYRLRESGRGLGIETYNLNKSTSYAKNDFTDADNIWDDTGYNQCATDAHWGAEATYDYFMQQHNFNSIDNKGYKLLSYVHYGNNVANAFWDGSKMTYGDGGSFGTITLKYMTALHVCAHEITHGFTTTTTGFVNSGENGALGEAFSDIFGSAVEMRARASGFNWRVGEEITADGKGVRNMQNPSEFQMPDTYKGTNWGSDAHYNMGVLSYWFYLLVEGDSGTNDLSNSYSVQGIGMDKAGQIAFRTCAFYLSSTSNHSSVRTYAIQSAKELFGDCSNELIQTTNAFYAVGLGAKFQPVALGSVDFSAAATSFCSVPATVSFTNNTVGAGSVTWDFGDGNTSNDFNPTHAYTSAGSYTVKLTAKECSGSNTQNGTKSNYISINLLSTPAANGATICGDQQATLSASAGGAGVLNWYDSPSSSNLLYTGTSFQAPAVAENTDFYVQESVPSASKYGGPADNTMGAGANYNATTQYMKFNVNSACTLKSVKVYAQGAGNRTIELRSSSGAVVSSKTVNVADGESAVSLDFALTPGNDYRLGVAGTTVNLYRNSAGAVFPYDVSGLVSITGSSATPGYYYFFYNWEVQGPPCTSPRVPVKVTQQQPATITQNGNVLTASAGNSYQWFLNGNAINGATSKSHTATQAGEYTVKITGNTCTTTSAKLQVYMVGVEQEDVVLRKYDIYPNPFTGTIRIELSSANKNIGAIIVLNTLGESMYHCAVNSNVFKGAIDASAWPSGMYFVGIKLADGDIKTYRIIKQ